MPAVLSLADDERLAEKLNWERVQEEVANVSSRIAAFLEEGGLWE